MNASTRTGTSATQKVEPLSDGKAMLRAQTLAARDALASEVRLAQSQACVAQLLALSEWQAAQRVMAYASFGSELDTSALLVACMQEPRRLVLPRIERNPQQRLSLHWVDDLVALVNGPWGIREPATDAPIAALSDIDCVVIPGVGFDRSGNRLGYGKGFYDQLLHARGARGARCSAPKVIALALDCQLVDAVPHGERDERIDILITPQGIWRFE
jgi:5-formyltetrahydrofolate cyclo-ligase